MPKLYIVDGYNVIHKINTYQRLLTDLEQARVRLIEDCAAFAALSGDNVMVVFDAHLGNAIQPQTEQILNVEVCFTRKGQTADTFIEHFCTQAARTEKIMVVTSDRMEQIMVASQGVRRLTPDEFAGLITEEQTESEQIAAPELRRYEISDRLDQEVAAALRMLMERISRRDDNQTTAES